MSRTDFRVFRFCSNGLCVLFAAASLLPCAHRAIAQGMPQGTPQGGATQPGLLQEMRSLPSSGNFGTSRMDAVPEDLSRVKLRSGYILDLRVFNVPDLTGTYTVDGQGDLVLPLAGAIHVAGLNITEAQKKVTEQLTGKYVLSPSVSLSISSYVPTYATVLGEVNSPGRVQILQPHSLREVLAMAGGVTLLASGSAEVKHEGSDSTAAIKIPVASDNLSAAGNTEILPGDEITVQRAGIVYVLGGVFRPGGYVMQEQGKLDVVQAIALASGTTLPAGIKGMRVIRRGPDGTIHEIPIDYRAMTKGKMPPMNLQAQDVVYVPLSKVKAALTGGAASVLGATSSAAIYAAR